MKILIASVTNKGLDILGPHLGSVQAQELPEGVEVEYAYVLDPDAPQEVEDFLKAQGVFFERAAPKPLDAEYSVSEESHHWTKPTFGWLAREKQALLDLAVIRHFDAIWLVDSDLVCDPGTLKSLITADKPIVSAVFWTRWTQDAPPLPQVWLTHPYEFQGKGLEAHEFLERLRNRRLTRVGGLGACTLIRTAVLPQVCFWPPVEGLPEHSMWQGEDRHFCVRASRAHVPLYADPWPDIFHIYRPSDRHKVPDLSRPKASAPSFGDLVSFVLEPCEEPEIAGLRQHFRGRLGALKLIAPLEHALMQTSPGQDRFLNLKFPSWWPIAHYRGQQRMVLLRMLDVKPWGLPPTLQDYELQDPFEVFM